MSEHQSINQTNYNTVRIDRYIARSFGLPSWKKLRRVSALESTNGTGARNPYKTSGRREMRALLESFRTFEPSPTHPNGNRAVRRGGMFKGRQGFGVEEICRPPKRW